MVHRRRADIPGGGYGWLADVIQGLGNGLWLCDTLAAGLTRRAIMLKQLSALMLAGVWLAGCATPPPPPVYPIYPVMPAGPRVPDPALIDRDGEADQVGLCQLQRELDSGTVRSRLVSITADVFFEHHYGYALSDRGCHGSYGLPQALLTIRGSDDGALRALHTFWSTAELNLGSRPMCVCVGQITFVDGSWTFHLVRVERVWWVK